MTIRSFASGLLERVPPWLRRKNGKPLILGLGDPLDMLAQNAADAVKMRFPTATVDVDALALTGAERRIWRGPGETAATYAKRLRIWLDSHRTRGGAYALLAQLFAYWRATLNVPIELVNYSGRRYSMDVSGNVTRDDITWNVGTGMTGMWAQDWIFFHVVAPVLGVDASFQIVPTTWAPAHLKRCTIIQIYGNGFVYGYPTSRTFGDGGVYGQDPPYIIVVDF